MQQWLDVAIQTFSQVIPHDALFLLIQGHKKGSFLNTVQGLFIVSTAEILCSGCSPGDSEKKIAE